MPNTAKSLGNGSVVVAGLRGLDGIFGTFFDAVNASIMVLKCGSAVDISCGTYLLEWGR